MRNYTILVVEDEKPLQEAISDKLERAGFDVVSARSVKQSLAYLEDISDIDVVWLDHYLIGKEDGLSLVEKMKGHEAWKDIPIFIVSNTATSDKVNGYLSLGIERYYVKAENRLDAIIEDIKESLQD